MRFGRAKHAGGARILFPFLGSVLSRSSLASTLRLASAQRAILVPAYLAIVPASLSLDAPLGAEAESAMALLELVEQRAGKAGVPVDSRIERGRSARHALDLVLRAERFDTVVLPARTATSDGFKPEDVAWALESAPGEVLVLRPAPPAKDGC